MTTDLDSGVKLTRAGQSCVPAEPPPLGRVDPMSPLHAEDRLLLVRTEPGKNRPELSPFLLSDLPMKLRPSFSPGVQEMKDYLSVFPICFPPREYRGNPFLSKET